MIICPPDNCTGCMACSSVCKQGAISISTDVAGFNRPSIDAQKCVSCNACRRLCPELKRVSMHFPVRCYAAAVTDQTKSTEYASGGIASSIARAILRRGGVVVACCGKDIFNVCHRIIRHEEDLQYIAGSKYVQSRISPELFYEMKEVMESGSELLFIGTGCQTAGVKNAFAKYSDKLILVDLVCHGVPSQQMLNDNIAYYQRLDRYFIPQSVHFREKEHGNIIYGWFADTADGKKVAIPWKKDAYMIAFLDSLSIRPCCSQCRYAFSARATDITLSDFWGLGRDSALYGRNGVSAVLVNTDNGHILFNSLIDIDKEQREVAEAVIGVGRLQTPSPSNQLSAKFFALYQRIGFQRAVEATTMTKFRRERLKKIPVFGRLFR